jgi:hypothetical protein
MRFTASRSSQHDYSARSPRGWPEPALATRWLKSVDCSDASAPMLAVLTLLRAVEIERPIATPTRDDLRFEVGEPARHDLADVSCGERGRPPARAAPCSTPVRGAHR